MAIEISDKSGNPLASVDPTAVTMPPAAVVEGPGFLLAPAPSGGPKAQIEAGS
jgi:hypothetical protein